MKKLLLLFLLVPVLALAQSAFDGTWKVNLANAQFSQKPDTIALQNGKYTCSTCIPKIDIPADGEDHKVPEAKEYDTIAVKQLDDKAIQVTRKKDGKVISESTETVSPDGKTLSVDFKNYPPQGEPVTGKVALTRVSEGPSGAHAMSGSWRTSKVENVSEQGLTFTFKSIANGLSMQAPTGESYEAKFDGNDYPVKADRAGGTISLKKVNDTTIQETYKQDGKPVAMNEMTVQGKTMKVSSKDLLRGTTTSYTADKQ